MPKTDEEEEDDSYQDLRQAVKEYRATMKEYYRAVCHFFLKKREKKIPHHVLLVWSSW